MKVAQYASAGGTLTVSCTNNSWEVHPVPRQPKASALHPHQCEVMPSEGSHAMMDIQRGIAKVMRTPPDLA